MSSVCMHNVHLHKLKCFSSDLYVGKFLSLIQSLLTVWLFDGNKYSLSELSTSCFLSLLLYF